MRNGRYIGLLVFLLISPAGMAGPDARLVAAEISLTRGQLSDALARVNQLLADSPDDYHAGFLKARILTANKQYDAAIVIYEALIQQVPNQLETYNNLAMLYAKKGDLETARQLLEKAIKSQPGYATVYDNLSKVYVEMARDSYGKALKLNLPRQSVTLAGLNVDKAAENIQLAQHATKADPTPETKSLQVASTKLPSVPEPVAEPESGSVSGPVTDSVVTQTTVSESVQTDNKTDMKAVRQKTETAAEEQIAKAKPVAKPQQLAFANKPAPHHQNNKRLVDKEEVITTLQGWAAAWSAQQVDLYLSFYDEKYHPTGLSRADWIARRKVRVKRPEWVQITLDDFTIVPDRKDRVMVKLIQRYRSANYHDKTKKQFLLQKTADGWRIMSEISLALLK